MKAKNGIDIRIADEFKSILVFPPVGILHSDSHRISSLVDHPEKCLHNIHNRNDRKICFDMASPELARLRHIRFVEWGHMISTLSKNEYTKFFQYSSLMSLKLLNLHQCQLSKIPTISHLTGLVELNATNNKIEQLPDEIIHATLQTLKIGRESSC